METIIVLDTGSILRLSYIESPTSKEKIIKLLTDSFEIFEPSEVFNEMEDPKESLEMIWDEIKLEWEMVKNRISKMDPPEECLDIVLSELEIDKRRLLARDKVPAEYKVIALALYLSRHNKNPIYVSTHESKAFSAFNYMCKKQQIGLVLCPFDILLHLHIHKEFKETDIDGAWRQLCGFPGTVMQFNFRGITYPDTLQDCILKCNTRVCR